MRLATFLSLFAICLLFSTCKKDNDDSTDTPKASIADLTKMLNVQEEAVLKWEESWKTHRDTLRAVFDMGQWLLAQPDVARVYLVDEWHMTIRYKSGLRSGINITMLGSDGLAIYRGGGGKYAKGSITKHVLGGSGTGGDDNKIIGNKKVMVFVPFESEFYKAGYPYLPLFEKSKTKLEVTLVTNTAATFSVLNTFQDYGFIILNTHGEKDGAFLLHTGVDALDIPKRPKGGWKEEEVAAYVAQSGNGMLELLLSGKLYWETFTIVDLLELIRPTETSIKLCVTDEYISEMPGKLKDAVVFGNHCYSGSTGGPMYQGDPTTGVGNLPDAWLKAGAAAYYAYAFGDQTSAPVLDEFCRQAEDSLITNLVLNGDSTGIAHLAGNAAEQFYEEKRSRDIANPALTKSEWLAYTQTLPLRVTDKLYLKLYHSPRYKYGCGTFTDPRDGETYKLACIGNQQWLADNLRYNAPGSIAYGNNPANIPLYGRLYDYKTVSPGRLVVAPGGLGTRGICPAGWHIPSRHDIDKMLATLSANGGSYGLQLKAKNPLWIGDAGLGHALRDKSGFAALPGGQADNDLAGKPEFENLGLAAVFWMSSPYFTTDIQSVGVFALQSSSADIQYDDEPAGIDDYVSCRCVKD